ncbi:MAG TPA: YciI family protein [Thermomicrobiales bacterium]|nr:YciI family protein [Thermomicrobiales bacterium]
MPLFVVTLEFTDDIDRRLEVRPRHREYLKSMLAQGKLHESGPFADDSGGIVIYEAADVAEVEDILANDPYAPAGIIASRTIREWNLVFSRTSS